jgi:hypothetical protein
MTRTSGRFGRTPRPGNSTESPDGLRVRREFSSWPRGSGRRLGFVRACACAYRLSAAGTDAGICFRRTTSPRNSGRTVRRIPLPGCSRQALRCDRHRIGRSTLGQLDIGWNWLVRLRPDTGGLAAAAHRPEWTGRSLTPNVHGHLGCAFARRPMASRTRVLDRYTYRNENFVLVVFPDQAAVLRPTALSN